MARTLAILTLVTLGVASSYAGQIMLGGNTGLNTTSGVTISGGAGAAAGSYMLSSFQGVGTNLSGVNGSVLCAGLTTGTCTQQANTAVPKGEPNNEFATANGVTFALINDPVCSNGGCNVWATTNAGGGTGTQNSTITIPVNVFGVTDVFTMLNDEYGLLATGSNTPTSVQFNFTDASNNASSLNFTLVNGTVIRDGFGCTDAIAGWSVACPTKYATTLSNGRYDVNGTASTYNAAVASVTAFNVWTGVYTQGTGAYLNTTGNLYLDAQDFYLGSSAANLTLTNIIIKNTPGLTAKSSRDLLSAVTLRTADVQNPPTEAPEPGTILLSIAGAGAIALVHRKRQKQAA